MNIPVLIFQGEDEDDDDMDDDDALSDWNLRKSNLYDNAKELVHENSYYVYIFEHMVTKR